MFGLFTRKKSFSEKARLLVNYEFPNVIHKRFEDNNPGKFKEAEGGLKLFFLLVLWNDENRFTNSVEMYNEIADELWHTFLLDTNGYQKFCEEIFGHFVHHNPYETKKELVGYFTPAKINLEKALKVLKYDSPETFKKFHEFSVIDGKFDLSHLYHKEERKSSYSSKHSYERTTDNVYSDPTWTDSLSSVFSSKTSSSSKSSCGSSCSSSCSSGSSCGGGGCGS